MKNLCAKIFDKVLQSPNNDQEYYVRQENTLFIGKIYPQNKCRMNNVIIQRATQSGGIFLVSQETAEGVLDFLKTVEGYDTGDKVKVYKFSSLSDLAEIDIALSPFFNVTNDGQVQHHFAEKKELILIVDDTNNIKYAKNVLVTIRDYICKLFDIEGSRSHREVNIPVFVENYNRIQIKGFSIIGMQARSLGFAFHYSSLDFDETTNTDEFISVVANSEYYVAYGCALESRLAVRSNA
jgi:hypothetical protein